MSDTLKIPKQEPKPDLTGTSVRIAEYDRGTLQIIHWWPINDYELRTDATEARRIVVELLDQLFPDPDHKGSRPLTEQDLSTIRLSVEDGLRVFASMPVL